MADILHSCVLNPQEDAVRTCAFCSKICVWGDKLFNRHKFRTMAVNHNGTTVSVVGDSRITPFGAKLRPGITGSATLKCRLENEMISEYVAKMQAGATECNDNVIYPDKVKFAGKECKYVASCDFEGNAHRSFLTIAYDMRK